MSQAEDSDDLWIVAGYFGDSSKEDIMTDLRPVMEEGRIFFLEAVWDRACVGGELLGGMGARVIHCERLSGYEQSKTASAELTELMRKHKIGYLRVLYGSFEFDGEGTERLVKGPTRAIN